MTTMIQARDAIFTLFQTAWLANGTSAPIALLWNNTAGDKPGEGSAGNALPWVRLTINHNTGRQDTLGGIGGRRFLAGGIFTAQIFTPFGDGNTLAYTLAEIIKAAMRAAPTTHAVWFYDIVPTEIGEDGPWFNVNVDATFRYQERA